MLYIHYIGPCALALHFYVLSSVLPCRIVLARALCRPGHYLDMSAERVLTSADRGRAVDVAMLYHLWGLPCSLFEVARVARSCLGECGWVVGEAERESYWPVRSLHWLPGPPLRVLTLARKRIQTRLAYQRR